MFMIGAFLKVTRLWLRVGVIVRTASVAVFVCMNDGFFIYAKQAISSAYFSGADALRATGTKIGH